MKALYITHFLPEPTAPARRIQAIMGLMESCGYDVEVALVGVFPEESASSDWMGHRIYLDKRLFLPSWRKLSKNLERLTSRRAVAFCSETVRSARPDLIVAYGISYEVMSALMMLRAQCGFSIIVDDTDWFDPVFSRDVASYVMARSQMRRFNQLDSRADGIIAISPYLRNHFEGLGANAFFLPSVVPRMPPLDESGLVGSKGEPIRFVYAGSLGAGKDLIEPVLDAFESLPPGYRGKVTLEVIGPSLRDIMEICGRNYEDVSGISIVGRKPHEYVEKALSSASFGFLLRKPERYARAGFSTKFSECMCMGIPMICNEVGGADSFLESGVDGIVLPDADVDTVRSALISVADSDSIELLAMRRAARRKAEVLFDPASYVVPFARFLEGVQAHV